MDLHFPIGCGVDEANDDASEFRMEANSRCSRQPRYQSTDERAVGRKSDVRR